MIAALDKGDAHHGDASRGLRRLIEAEAELLISTINYAEALVRPAEDERTLRAAIDAISTLGIRPVAPGVPVARDAARIRGFGISLADGFALATASAHDATVASFDKRVRRALRPAGLRLCSALR